MAYESERACGRRTALGGSPGVALLPVARAARVGLSSPFSFTSSRSHARPAILLAGCLLLYLVLVAASLIEGLVRPLQTLSNVVSSLREGDYSFRARGAGAPGRAGRTGGGDQRARRPAAEAARALA